MMRYRHTIGFLVLCLLLGGPFILRTIAPSLEAYPAIIMPGGSGMVVAENGKFYYNNAIFYGIDAETGQETQVKSVDLVRPAEVDFAVPLASRDFGLDPNQKTRIWFRRKFGVLKDIRLANTQITDEERRETRQWLSKRLIDAGCDGRVLIVRWWRCEVDPEARSSTPVEIDREAVFDLN